MMKKIVFPLWLGILKVISGRWSILLLPATEGNIRASLPKLLNTSRETIIACLTCTFIKKMKVVKRLMLILFFAYTAFIEVKAQSVPAWKVNDVVQYINQSDSVLVVSFWATFCKPCVEEIPYLESISQKYKDQKVKVLLVSLDLPDFFPAKIERFVKENNYSSQVIWLNESNADYFCPRIDKSWSGAIPSTVIINKRTGYKKFIEEQMKPSQFEAELKKAL